jgi:trimeric autotransporter adhesin
VGLTAPAQEVTVTNVGTGPAGATTAALNGSNQGDFAIAANGCTAPALSAGQSCTISVTFTPTTIGVENAALTVTASPGGTAVVTLAGTGCGCAPLEVTPTAQDFGSVLVGASGTPVTFTVFNDSIEPSGPIQTSMSGSGASAFPILSDTCSENSLASQASCAVQVQFSPASTDTIFATLTVSATPGGTGESALYGTGIATLDGGSADGGDGG